MLFQPQQKAVRELLEAADDAQTAVFKWIDNESVSQAHFEGSRGVVIVRMNEDDLIALIQEGYIKPVTRETMKLTNAAKEAVERNFATVSVAATGATHVTTNIITIHGDNNAMVAQGVNVSVAGVDAERLLGAIRDAANGDVEILDQVGNLAEELNTGKPQARKLKAFLSAALARGRENASLVSACVALANFLHLGHWMEQMVAVLAAGHR